MKGYAKGMAHALERAEEEAVKRKAHKFFELTQRNINTMNIGDRGTLLRSGYCRRVEGTKSWVVGYSAPYAWYVDLGTGPRAGHGPYSAPPPFDVIYAWVRRNVQVRTTHKPSGGSQLMGGVGGFQSRRRRVSPNARRVTLHRADGSVITVIKPRKDRDDVRRLRANVGAGYRPGIDKESPETALARQTAKNIMWSIFKHGTHPKPFWRNAQASMKSVNRREDARVFGRLAQKAAKYAFFNLLRKALRIVGGAAR
jgi:hypothetical protein